MDVSTPHLQGKSGRRRVSDSGDRTNRKCPVSRDNHAENGTSLPEEKTAVVMGSTGSRPVMAPYRRSTEPRGGWLEGGLLSGVPALPYPGRSSGYRNTKGL